MKKLVLLIAGALLGALSYVIAATVSGKFEPFDSESGFLVTQIILSCASLVVGIKRGMVACVILVFGAYLGMNAFAFAFGGSETRAWAMLGFITTVALVISASIGEGAKRQFVLAGGAGLRLAGGAHRKSLCGPDLVAVNLPSGAAI